MMYGIGKSSFSCTFAPKFKIQYEENYCFDCFINQLI